MKRVNEANLNSEKYWDDVYGREQNSGKRRVDNERFEFLLGAMSDRQQYDPGASMALLDAGCGPGEMLGLVHAVYPHWKFTGVDFSEFVVTENRAWFPQMQFSIASVNQLPLCDSKFQVVNCMETLEHVDDPEGAVRELVRVTENRGNLVLSVPFYDRNPSDEHVWSFSVPDCIALTERFGEVRDLRVLASGLSICWTTKVKK